MEMLVITRYGANSIVMVFRTSTIFKSSPTHIAIFYLRSKYVSSKTMKYEDTIH